MSEHKYKYQIGDRVTIEGAGSEVFTVMARWTDSATFRNYYEIADWTGARRTGIGEDTLAPAPAPEAHRFEVGDPVTLARCDHKWTVADSRGTGDSLEYRIKHDKGNGHSSFVWAHHSKLTLDTDAINDSHADAPDARVDELVKAVQDYQSSRLDDSLHAEIEAYKRMIAAADAIDPPKTERELLQECLAAGDAMRYFIGGCYGNECRTLSRRWEAAKETYLQAVKS